LSDLSKEKWTWNIRSLNRAGTVTTVAREIVDYRIQWEYRRSDGAGDGTEPAGEYTFFHGNEKRIMN
jgi:hypothetical protein